MKTAYSGRSVPINNNQCVTFKADSPRSSDSSSLFPRLYSPFPSTADPQLDNWQYQKRRQRKPKPIGFHELFYCSSTHSDCSLFVDGPDPLGPQFWASSHYFRRGPDPFGSPL
ncbi:hypothetical protein Nepgr_010057 [Nepenthes gracilis]|uniref:Uncharacterized protein n=1 Tax=Nepenthes gracilis TaxID=150966 RepID=A0AAD3XKQ1_NEPGR|nr:hypothetical protein Nepgr_010057 [Nepenthes gracilis]